MGRDRISDSIERLADALFEIASKMSGSRTVVAGDLESIDVLDLSVRARKGLVNNGIKTMGQLRLVTDAELESFRGLGKVNRREIWGALVDHDQQRPR